MKGPAPSDPAPGRSLWWAAAVTIAAGVAFVSAEWHGRASRVPFKPPAQLAQVKAASVGSAADAFALWRGSGVNGRRLVVLSGQWSSPREGSTAGARGGGPTGDLVNASSALYWAARSGVVRGFDVVMPPAAFERRLATDARHKVFQAEDGAYRHDLHGFWLRFSLPRALVSPSEPALVLVEPTWFADGAPADPIAWLSLVGLRSDLVLVALDDPAAADEQRRAAAEYARTAKLIRLNVRTR